MSTNACRYLQLDVFSQRAGCGNPLGVVFGADDWSTQRMQGFARWANLVETTFVLPATESGASYRLRIFTPSREIAFAGHPSIGSAFAALSTGFCAASDGRLIQQCDAGLLPIMVEGSPECPMLSVAAPAARVEQATGADMLEVARILDGLTPGSLPPGLVSGGRRWWLAELADERQLRAWNAPVADIAALAKRSDTLGLCLFARSSDPAFELVVRAFPAGAGIVEDPASGAANALIAAYIASLEPKGALSRGYRVSQGRELGRDALLTLRIEADNRVWVGGHCALVIDGKTWWPQASQGFKQFT
ncbi:MAG: PhzF family phenazine biosynthesis protein [Gammaproteobacteria bacterium HGW-Gammaproteobacteria-4]|jgi:PhzF family phenazine biosynthesis protein|nr:MAG: PhzF family phenazine biosynthesis protein [Gammaproteobacteria bacterium HGW-Gammaproteobacteria-4]